MVEIATLVQCNEKLVTALSSDPLGTANALFSSDFIRENTLDKMQLPSTTPKEKATELVIAIRATVKNKPQRFRELIEILRRDPYNSDIVEILNKTNDKLKKGKATIILYCL